jgi:tetratricopeptide (TPR) repeat protein
MANSHQMASSKFWIILFLANFVSLCDVAGQSDSAIFYQQKSRASLFSDLDSSLFYAERSLSFSEGVSDSLLGIILTQYSSALVEGRQLDKADSVLKIAKVLNEQSGNETALSTNYISIGNVAFYRFDNEEALINYRKSLEIDRVSGTPVDYAKSLLNFGILLNRMGREVDAKNAYLRALEIFREQEDRGSEIRGLVNLCILYGAENKPFFSLDSSILMGEQAVALSKELLFDFGVAKANGAIASPLIRKGYTDPSYKERGLKAAVEAREFFQETDFKSDYQEALLNEGYAYESLGNISKALSISEDLLTQGYIGRHEVYRLQYRAYKQAGDFQQALAKHELYQQMMDSLYENSLEQKLNEIQTRYETEKKDSEIAQLNQQAAIKDLEISQKNLLMAAMGVFLLFTVGAGGLFYRQHKLREMQKLSDLEQRFLRSQMSPHFIFNALAAIQNFMLQGDVRESIGYLSRFGKLMRQILEHSRKEFITIEQEIEMLRNYIEIQRLRYDERFTYSIEVSEDIDQVVVQIPPLFAQPLVENAIEHGIKDMKEGGRIEVRFELKNHLIELTVADNGAGLEQSDSDNDHQSLSSQISRERLAIFQSRFKQKFSLQLTEQDQLAGTKAVVLLPFQR